MDKQTYLQIYGKIKILNQIKQRHPVINVNINDPNRKYMIKFKYGNLTPMQENKFHNDIKKLIYRVMHNNNVMMDWDDVYQEIWKKIIKSRHTWNQSKGTMVSTWITIVANSVINTLRQNVNRHNSRYCLYEDLCASTDDDAESSDKQKMDLVQFINDDNNLYDKSFQKNIWNEKYIQFLNSLNESEKLFMQAVYDMDNNYYCNFYKVKVSHTFLKNKLGFDDTTYYMIINNIKQKYCKAFNVKLENKLENNEMIKKYHSTEYLF